MEAQDGVTAALASITLGGAVRVTMDGSVIHVSAFDQAAGA